jgi:hypothetical protein
MRLTTPRSKRPAEGIFSFFIELVFSQKLGKLRYEGHRRGHNLEAHRSRTFLYPNAGQHLPTLWVQSPVGTLRHFKSTGTHAETYPRHSSNSALDSRATDTPVNDTPLKPR